MHLPQIEVLRIEKRLWVDYKERTGLKDIARFGKLRVSTRFNPIDCGSFKLELEKKIKDGWLHIGEIDTHEVKLRPCDLPENLRGRDLKDAIDYGVLYLRELSRFRNAG